MKEILETTQLEYGKSSFLIDLVQHKKGVLYIEILQSINSFQPQQHQIKINPSILSEIIKTLQNYQAKIPKEQIQIQKDLTDEDQEKIISYYLKGVSIKDLAIQFDQTEELLKMVLRNKNITVISDVKPKKRYWKRKWKK